MVKKAEAYKQYNDAAVTQMIIEKLPEIAASISEPLTKTEKIVIIDSGKNGEGSGASKVSGYVTDIITQIPETIEALTGINLTDSIKKNLSKGNTEEPYSQDKEEQDSSDYKEV